MVNTNKTAGFAISLERRILRGRLLFLREKLVAHKLQRTIGLGLQGFTIKLPSKLSRLGVRPRYFFAKEVIEVEEKPIANVTPVANTDSVDTTPILKLDFLREKPIEESSICANFKSFKNNIKLSWPDCSRFNNKISSALSLMNTFVPRISSAVPKMAGSFLSVLVVAGAVILSALYGPRLYYFLFPAEQVPVIAKESGSVMGGDFARGTGASSEGTSTSTTIVNKIPLPPVDESLPEGDWLIIPKIGVRSLLQDDESWEEALKTGVWRDPEFGKPGDQTAPMIVAGHRFGWKWWWKDNYWKYHSFYLLPTLEPGDRVEVISEKRRYTYEIYAGEEGEEISDYQADLILYTCKYLESPVRHFRYARLLDLSKDSQASGQGATTAEPSAAPTPRVVPEVKPTLVDTQTNPEAGASATPAQGVTPTKGAASTKAAEPVLIELPL